MPNEAAPVTDVAARRPSDAPLRDARGTVLAVDDVDVEIDDREPHCRRRAVGLGQVGAAVDDLVH